MFLKCTQGKHLTPAEEVAVHYINQNMEEVVDLTISEIADRAFVSAPIVSRAIRKCGIQKLPDLRKQIAMREIAKENFLMNEIFEKSYRECTKTLERMDTSTMLRAVEYIRSARKIFVLANGYTRLAAQEFEMQLQWLGFNVSIQWDLNIIERLDMMTKPQDLVIIFSVTNSRPELAIGAKKAKQKGAKIITCCCTEGTLLEEISDITILGYYESIFSKKDFSNTNLLALSLIGRTITEYLSAEAE